MTASPMKRRNGVGPINGASNVASNGTDTCLATRQIFDGLHLDGLYQIAPHRERRELREQLALEA
jgi:hypothetical protein